MFYLDPNLYSLAFFLIFAYVTIFATLHSLTRKSKWSKLGWDPLRMLGWLTPILVVVIAAGLLVVFYPGQGSDISYYLGEGLTSGHHTFASIMVSGLNIAFLGSITMVQIFLGFFYALSIYFFVKWALGNHTLAFLSSSVAVMVLSTQYLILDALAMMISMSFAFLALGLYFRGGRRVPIILFLASMLSHPWTFLIIAGVFLLYSVTRAEFLKGGETLSIPLSILVLMLVITSMMGAPLWDSVRWSITTPSGIYRHVIFGIDVGSPMWDTPIFVWMLATIGMVFLTRLKDGATRLVALMALITVCAVMPLYVVRLYARFFWLIPLPILMGAGLYAILRGLVR